MPANHHALHTTLPTPPRRTAMHHLILADHSPALIQTHRPALQPHTRRHQRIHPRRRRPIVCLRTRHPDDLLTSLRIKHQNRAIREPDHERLAGRAERADARRARRAQPRDRVHERGVERRRSRDAGLGRAGKRGAAGDAVPPTATDTASSPDHCAAAASAAAAAAGTAAVVGRGELGRGADGPDLEGAVGGARGEQDAIGGAAEAAGVGAEGGSGRGGEHADGPDGVGVAFERGFGVDATAFPDADAAVLAAGEDPAVALGATAGGEGGRRGAGGEGCDDAFVAAVGEIGLDIEVVLTAWGLLLRVAGLLAITGNVAIVCDGNDPPFDHAIVASGADFGLRRTATSSENDAAYDIQVTPQAKSDFESLGIGLRGVGSRIASLITASANWTVGFRRFSSV